MHLATAMTGGGGVRLGPVDVDGHGKRAGSRTQGKEKTP